MSRNPNPNIRQTDIFVAGTDGYHTYRIPALVVSKQGTLLALCEGRRYGAADDGKIDLVLKRSFDNGATWEDMQVIWQDGENTIGNPCPVVDRETGTIWLPFCRNNERVFVTKSADDGASWATPVEITEDVIRPSWGWYATGPGHGIQLSTGRLVVPCDHAEAGVFRSHVIYGDDHGDSWQLGGLLDEGTDECEAVETSQGRVYLNMRDHADRNCRAYAWSDDGGQTWSAVAWDETLVEPVCQGSVVRLSDDCHHDTNRVLFCNPASTERNRLTVRLSYDECQTWNAGKVVHAGPAAYSDLGITGDMTICCFYERGEEHPYEKITFAQFSLEWLTDGADRL